MPDIFVAGRHAEGLPSVNLNHVHADLAQPGWTDQLPVAGVDAVVYLAQSSFYREFPAKAVDIHQINTASALELAHWGCSKGVKKFIYMSSGSVYGNSVARKSESDSCVLESMYAASKLSAEYLLQQFSGLFEITVFRLYFPYGPGQSGTMIPAIIDNYLKGNKVTLAEDVGVSFTPIFVDDCIEYLWRALQTGDREGYRLLNLTGDETVNLKQMLDVLQSRFGKPALIDRPEAAPASFLGNNTALKAALGNIDFMAFQDGILKLVDSAQFPGRND